MESQLAPTPSSRFRYCLYAGLATALLLAAVLHAGLQDRLTGRGLQLIHSDGQGYYAYLPSLVIDGDLDFTNQATRHWHDEGMAADLLSRRTPIGLPENKYPVGIAVTLAPAFMLSHGLTLATNTVAPGTLAPDGYSPLYQIICTGWIMALGCLTLCLIDRLIVRHLQISPAAALGAVLLFWIGTHWFWYFTLEPFMAHVISTFWVTCIVAIACRPLRPGAMVFGAFALGMAIICRPTNLFILPVVLTAIWRWRQELPSHGRGIAAALLVGAIPPAIQAAIWHLTTGSIIRYSYGSEGFNWTHPALWQTLFSERHGLLLWSPMLLLSIAGLISAWRTSDGAHRPLLASLFGSALLLWYFNSAWHCWWFGWSFGGRAFLELAPLWIIGLATAIQRAAAMPPPMRRILAGAAMIALVHHFALVALYRGGLMN